MHAASEGHLVEVADVTDVIRAVGELRLATDVGKPGEDVHELHGPRPERLDHDETRPESSALSGAGSHSPEHDRGRGVETLRSKPGTVEQAVEKLEPDVLYPGRGHRHHDEVEIRQSGGRGPNISAERSIGSGIVWIEQDSLQDIAIPIGRNLVGRGCIGSIQRNERDPFSTNPGHGVPLPRRADRIGHELRGVGAVSAAAKCTIQPESHRHKPAYELLPSGAPPTQVG
jgi:hypothetical protein